MNMAWIVFGSAIGPYLFSLGQSATGSYNGVLRWTLLIPGLVVIVAVLAFNLVGDGLRDASDPYSN